MFSLKPKTILFSVIVLTFLWYSRPAQASVDEKIVQAASSNKYPTLSFGLGFFGSKERKGLFGVGSEVAFPIGNNALSLQYLSGSTFAMYFTTSTQETIQYNFLYKWSFENWNFLFLNSSTYFSTGISIVNAKDKERNALTNAYSTVESFGLGIPIEAGTKLFFGRDFFIASDFIANTNFSDTYIGYLWSIGIVLK